MLHIENILREIPSDGNKKEYVFGRFRCIETWNDIPLAAPFKDKTDVRKAFTGPIMGREERGGWFACPKWHETEVREGFAK